MLALIAACGDDAPPARTALNAPLALTVTPEMRGLAVRYSTSLVSLAAQFQTDAADAAARVVHEQVYSEVAHSGVGGEPRRVEPRIDRRLAALYGDPATAPLVGADARTYWAINLHRLDREWLVDWNGLERDEPANRDTALTFTIRATQHDGDYQADVIARIVDAFDAVSPRPHSVILGVELERHYLAVPDDWPAVAQFVRDAAAAIRTVAPGTRVSVGLNWSNFVDEVAPRFLAASDQPEVNYQTLLLAWQAVVEPLYFDRDETGGLTPVMDFYAFSSFPDPARYASPASMPADHYAGLPTLLETIPAVDLPVAWFALGWPSSLPSSDDWAGLYERFLAGAGGPNTELVAWWGYNHLNQSDCNTIQRLGLLVNQCYRGMRTPSGALSSGRLFDVFFGRAAF